MAEKSLKPFKSCLNLAGILESRPDSNSSCVLSDILVNLTHFGTNQAELTFSLHPFVPYTTHNYQLLRHNGAAIDHTWKFAPDSL